jgi:hypothetical protein
VSVQKGFGDLLFAVSYLGNKGAHAWRANEYNPAVYGPGATTGNTNQRRLLYTANQAQGQYYSTIGMIDDTGRSSYNGILLSAQKRMSNSWSLTSYTWSVQVRPVPGSPGDDVIHGTRISTTRMSLTDHVGTVGSRHATHVQQRHSAIISDHTRRPGCPATGHRSRPGPTSFTGTGASAVRIRRSCGDKTAATIESRRLREPGHRRLRRRAVPHRQSGGPHNIAISRTFRWAAPVAAVPGGDLPAHQPRNLDPPSTALNSSTFGRITGAGDPRIMQLALKFSF